MASTVVSAVRKSFRELHGVVVTAGLMQRTVKVRVGGQRWNGKLKKVPCPISQQLLMPVAYSC
jgi:small subunit ribosomal protein S17